MSKWGLIDNTLEGRQKLYFPHFFNHDVPLEPKANRAWRDRVWFTTNKDFRKTLKRMCAEDFLFYISGFGTIFDAGDESGQPGPVSFLPYEYQVEAFTQLWHCLHVSRSPVRVPKPRKMGLTWMVMSLFNHCWQFMPNRHLLVGSHREEEVTGSVTLTPNGVVGEWSKLLPKVDFMHYYQPRWLLPAGYQIQQEPCRTRMKFMNPENGSILWATSASSKTAHSERGYAVFWDEASLTEQLYEIIAGLSEFAPVKFWVSTIGNLSHPFSTTLKEAPGVVQLKVDWSMHPIYSEGMTIDPETGAKTSPWLNRKLAEINYDRVLANRLYYADESQQEGGYYAPSIFQTILGTTTKPGTLMDPLHTGELDIALRAEGRRVTRWCEQPNGRWKLWLEFDRDGNPPRNTRYIFGIDTAAGTQNTGGRGASNSVIAVADWRTGDIVAEFATDGLQPLELAWLIEAAGWWFSGDDSLPAMVVPESNGPGGQTVDALVRKLHYPNVWMKDPSKLEYGWFKDGRGPDARKAFGLHQEMLGDGRLKERSVDCVREMRHYQHNPNGVGAPVHSAALLAEDPADKRDNHGDRVIARVCLCQALQRAYATLPLRGQAPYGSYRYAVEQEKKLTADHWDSWKGEGHSVESELSWQYPS